MLTQWAKTFPARVLILILGLCACGKTGEKLASSSSLGSYRNVLGSLGGQSGSQSDMAGWVIALISKDSQIARVSEVDASGLFAFQHVYLSQAYTLALFSPSYVLRAVLSQPGKATGQLLQYFKITGGTLPRLTHKGAIVTMQGSEGVAFTTDKVVDSDFDGLPDGVAGMQINALPLPKSTSQHLAPSPLAAWELTTTMAGNDTDLDGLDNKLDPDIDGDGLLNIFDTDDDGDTILDAFDQDANGDLVADSGQELGDLYFPYGIRWLMVKYDMLPQGDGTYQRALTFLAQLHSQQEPVPLTVQIRGAPSLLNGAQIEATAADGQTVPQAWDRLLKDDGVSEDSASGDGLFARRIVLEAGRTPLSNQVVFFQLSYGSAAQPWFQEYAYTFSPLVPTAITPRFEAITRTVALEGDPFGDIQDFLWTITVYQVGEDDTEQRVYTSPGILGTERAYILPDNVLESGETYRYKATAQVLDRVSGYPAYSIDSETQDIPLAP